MEKLLMKYFRNANSYQSIDPTCFDLQEFTETWLEENKQQLIICGVVSSATYNADHLWKKATEFTYALEKNGYLACLEDLEKAGIIELKNIDKNH